MSVSFLLLTSLASTQLFLYVPLFWEHWVLCDSWSLICSAIAFKKFGSCSFLVLYVMHLADNQKLVMCFSCLQGTAQNSDVSKTWYPPLEKTISCLSKLYRCLEPAVFTGLAQV